MIVSFFYDEDVSLFTARMKVFLFSIFIIAIGGLRAFAECTLSTLPFFEQLCEEVIGDQDVGGGVLEGVEKKDENWKAIRPFYYKKNEKGEAHEVHFLYPLASRYEKKGYWSADFLGLMRHEVVFESERNWSDQFMFFPFYFSKKSSIHREAYRGIMPIGGSVKAFLGYEEAEWVMFPLYVALKKPMETRYFAPWPFIQWMKGQESRGCALWPLFGFFERKGQYSHDFALWPLIYHYQDDLFKKIPRIRKGFLPFYAMESSEKGCAQTWGWPFFGYVKRYDPEYYEKHYFWPLLVQGRGAVSYVNRWAPVYTHSQKPHYQKKWVLWPLMKIEQTEKEDLIIERSQFLYFLIWHEAQKSKRPNQPFYAQKTHVWPFFSYRQDGKGVEEFQCLSPFDVFFPHNETVRRLYSPLFALWRYRRSENGDIQQSFLFNLITMEKTAVGSSWKIGPFLEWKYIDNNNSLSLLKGVVTLEQKKDKKALKLFWASSSR